MKSLKIFISTVWSTEAFCMYLVGGVINLTIARLLMPEEFTFWVSITAIVMVTIAYPISMTIGYLIAYVVSKIMEDK